MMMRLLLLVISSFIVIVVSSSSSSSSSSVLVVGSINADIIVPIDRFPKPGETIVCPQNHPYKDDAGKTIAGGKGANQATAIARLNERSIFVCQFGNDANALMLEKVLNENNVDISFSKKSDKSPSGLGLVMLERDGSGSAIVVGGANAEWPEKDIIAQNIRAIFTQNKISCVLLQMEVPQYVNEIVAEVAVEFGIDVFQDVGGEDRDISSEHLKRCSFLSPNLTELKRLTRMECNSEEQITDAAKELQRRGSSNVLVTLGSDGSLLLLENGSIIRQPAMAIDRVIDETGCGDNFRSSFVVAHFVNKKSVKDSLLFASAAGASAAGKLGAIPSMATRSDINEILKKNNLDIRGGESSDDDDDDCPFLFASRLNSMKDRRDLCQEGEEEGVLGYIARQGRIKGLDLVDFNYPQHITSPVVTEELKQELLEALSKANKRCGAICTRYPKLFQAGAFTNPNEELRKRAIQITKEACEWSMALNANEVVVWSAFCGYDYPLQVDYNVMWDRMVAAFQEVCDAYPNVKVSLEYKPTDENTRFFAVPSTGSSQQLVAAVNRENFGLTLDFGHCLMSGENPAQSVAYANRHGNKLFGVQLGDGYGRLGAEDGLAFGSINTKASLEFVYWLIRTSFKGHIYFDTFARNEDPVREAEYNIRTFKRMYKLAKSMINNSKIDEILNSHDAMSMLEYLESSNI